MESATNSENERDILVLTGTRAEYGLLKSSMRAIRDCPCLALSVVATGMHLSPQHGLTVDEITDDGFTVDRSVTMHLDADSGTAMARSLGIGITGLAQAFSSVDPDIVLLLGDRDEAVAGAVAAAHMNIPVAHIHGGDSMHGATIDDSNRHAITKFAHIHFPASERSAERIRKLGEEPWRISVVGAPGLDGVLAGDYTSPKAVLQRYGLDQTHSLLLVLQHPLTTQPDDAGHQMKETLDAIDGVDAQKVLIYPNSDPGSSQMISEITGRKFGDDVRTFRSLPRREFLGLMAAADVMVGNSSSGIIESPAFDLPVVDIGPRQSGRERAANTFSVGYDATEIRGCIRKCLNSEEIREKVSDAENPYDFGGAGERIRDLLQSVDIDENLLTKQLTY